MIDTSNWQLPLIRSFTDLRYHTTRVTSLARNKGQPIVIARNNKPEAVLLSVRVFEQLLAQMQQMQDQKDVAGSMRVLEKTKTEDWVPVKQAAEQLLGKGYVQRFLRRASSKTAKKVA